MQVNNSTQITLLNGAKPNYELKPLDSSNVTEKSETSSGMPNNNSTELTLLEGEKYIYMYTKIR